MTALAFVLGIITGRLIWGWCHRRRDRALEDELARRKREGDELVRVAARTLYLVPVGDSPAPAKLWRH